MKLPIWVWHPKERRYVVFPYHLLVTFSDGKQGIPGHTSKEQNQCVEEFDWMFHVDHDNPDRLYGPAHNGLMTLISTTRFVLKTPKPKLKNIPKGPRWYSQNKHQIRGYQK